MIYSKEQRNIRNKIALLKLKQTKDLAAIEMEAQLVKKQFNPSQIVLQSIKSLYSDYQVKNKTFNVIVNLVSGFISRKVIVGKSGSTFKALLSQLTQYLTTQFVVKNVKS